ncbi:hypothetical protein OG390_46380 [Streptomyces sp. NBC_00996]|nr:hypothetical protein OG390_46380 [Streptomyces sp. NBC_00996]
MAPAAAGAMDAAVHAWDIAVATGQDASLDEELAEGIWAAAERLVDHLRNSYGVFAPAREVPEGCSRAVSSTSSWPGTRSGRT